LQLVGVAVAGHWSPDIRLAALVLLVGVSRNYGYLLVSPDLIGITSKALGAAATLCLLGLLWHRAKSLPLLVVLCWYGFEELQTLGCSVAYAVKPWPVQVGQSICSAWIGFDLGSIGILIVAIIILVGYKNGEQTDVR
jgi:hypothetical protein